MKFLVLLITIFGSAASFGDHYSNELILDCRVTKMAEYYFEEALSKDEYPDIEVSQAPNGDYSVQLGMNSAYETSEGNKITLEAKEFEGTKVTIQTSYDETFTIEIEWRKTLALGRLKVKESPDKRFRTIANIVCLSGFTKTSAK